MRHLNSFCRVSLVIVFLQIGIYETYFFVSFSIYAMTHTIHPLKTILWPNESTWSELSLSSLSREWSFFEIRLFETDFLVRSPFMISLTPIRPLKTNCGRFVCVRHGVCVTVARLFLTSLLGLEWRRQLAPARNQIISWLVCCSGLRDIAACCCVLLCIPRWCLHEIRSDRSWSQLVCCSVLQCVAVLQCHGCSVLHAGTCTRSDQIRSDHFTLGYIW